MYNEDYTSMNDLKSSKKKSKHNKIIEELEEIEDYSYDLVAPTPSTDISCFLKSAPSKKQEVEIADEIEKDGYDPDQWFDELLGASYGTSKSRGKLTKELFSTGKKKKKKKKKSQQSDLVDYRKEFEPEMTLYKNLLSAQNKFTESLQREYDQIKGVKSSSRGIPKQISDLVENITQARSLSMQLVDKNVNAKKLIAELNFKQKKEFGSGALGEGENMADYASTYLKQMLNERHNIVSSTGEALVSDYDDDEMLDEISSMFDEDDERPEEVDKYLKYEKDNIDIYVVITDNDIENYEFLAKSKNGEIIDDYPMPNHTSISVNRSTNIATDTYGKKYSIIWY